MVEASLDALDLDALLSQQGHDFVRHFSAADVGVLFLVVVRGEVVEIVDQIGDLGGVDLDFPGRCLPMGREDDDGFGLHFCGDFSPDLL